MQTTNPARAGAQNVLRYEHLHPDGSKEVFDSPADSHNNVYMTQIVDPQGNTVNLAYESISQGYRLASVTDALGQVTTLAYGLADDPLKITAMTDPFGRTAQFGYTATSPHHLISITDVVGIVSQFTYAPGTDAITSLTTPYGTTTFAASQDVGGDTDLLVTDPNGGQERVLARWADGIDTPPEAAPAVPYAYTGSEGDFDNALEELNTYYWDKKAMMDAPGDLTKAHVYHWLYNYDGANQASGVLYCEKAALESRIWYNYDRPADAPPWLLASSDRPTGMARLLDDGSTQATQSSYNALGFITQSIDPVGRQINYTYADNNIDLVLVQGANGDVLRQIIYDPTYPAHLPKTIIDASGQPTNYTYNTTGQILTVTNNYTAANPSGDTTTYGYDVNSNLVSITGPVVGAATTYTYDGYGRRRTMTDSEGYTITFDYDALNRLAVETYPDGTYEQYVYETLDLGWKKDRINRRTSFSYDLTQNLVGVTDPLGRVTRFGYCICGSRDSVIDPVGNVTAWTRDVEKRPTAKTYADGTKELYSYDLIGRLASVTDAKGQVKSYSYDTDNTLKQITYVHAQIPTASVSFTYDPNYNRVLTMTDGTGITSYTYNPYSNSQPPAATTGAGRMATETGPLANATIAYGYDELGRISIRSINGTANNETSIRYDSLGRTSAVTNPLGAFAYTYLDATNRLSAVTYPNAQSTTFSYFGNTGDQRLQDTSNLNAANAVISKFDYTYNAVGDIQTWTQQTDSNTPKVYSYQYDAVDQLTGATLANSTTQAILHQYGYGYDLAANRTSQQIDTQINAASNNGLNQVTATQGGGPMTFSGTLSEPSAVTVGGRPAVVSGTTFTGSANVTPGNNQVIVSATNASGQTTTHTYQVTTTGGAAQAFTYDPNGNMLSDGVGSYQWDAENRLIGIKYVGTQNSSVMSYDGLGRRVSIIELTNGAVTSTKNFVWVGTIIADERDANGNVMKRFYPQGEQIGGTAYFFTRDHLGSIREMTDATGSIRARYDYDPYGQVSKLSGDLACDLGFTGDYVHASSGFNLTLRRIYGASIGRWLSRDPLADAEMNQGPNLYMYVRCNPVRFIDPLGTDVTWAPAPCPNGCQTRFMQVVYPSIIGSPFVDDNGTQGTGPGDPTAGGLYPNQVNGKPVPGLANGMFTDAPGDLWNWQGWSAVYEVCRVCLCKGRKKSIGPCKRWIGMWSWYPGPSNDLSHTPNYPPSNDFKQTVNQSYPSAFQ